MLAAIIVIWIVLYGLFAWQAIQELRSSLSVLVPALLTAATVIGTLVYLLRNMSRQANRLVGFYLFSLCLILGLSSLANAFVLRTGATDNPPAVSTIATLVSSLLGVGMGAYRRKLAPWIADYKDVDSVVVKNGGAGLICFAVATSVGVVFVEADLVALWATGAIGFSVGSIADLIV